MKFNMLICLLICSEKQFTYRLKKHKVDVCVILPVEKLECIPSLKQKRKYKLNNVQI